MTGLLLGATVLTACRPAATAPKETEILWDTWGIPHIYAPDAEQAFKAFGYAQAASHGNLVLKLYGEARGRAAEYWGAANLPSDRFVRTMGIPARAASWYQGLTPAMRANLDAFAAGFNAYAAGHSDQIVDSVEVVLPVTPQDVLAHGQKIVNFLFMLFGQAELPETMRNDVRPGSNVWAIGPKRSASGNPLLIGNPHLPWNDLYLFYEAHIVTPDRNLYGTGLVGMPTIAIGFNDHVGWSHTVNTQDGADVFRLVKDGDGYRFDGARREFVTRFEVLTVKGAAPESLAVKESVHGPVFSEDRTSALALRVTGLDDPNALEQWWEMGGATGMAQFESAVRRLHIPFFNIMAASTDGHIYYFFGGKTPRRQSGDFAAWTGPVRGDTSATLWTETLRYDELPHVMDPATGWLQNANDPPWTATWPLVFDPDSFPSYLAPRQMAFRPQRSALMQLADSSVTFEEALAAKHDSYMALTDRILPDLAAAVAASNDPDAKAAMAVFDQWDRRANPESRGAVLFTDFVSQYWRDTKGKLYARAWQLDSAVTTPSGLANPKAAVKALVTAGREVTKKFGALDVPWGEVARLRYGGKDFPGNGASGDPFGVFRVAYYREDGDGKRAMEAGDSYYQVVEFGKPVRAKVLTSYGNSTQPGSKHFGDQVELFSKQVMRDAWRTRAEVEANLQARDTIP
ncbi:MAG: acylase [Gemmatimonadetes bacterium]|nr:acylase [Gemmatimonadota bacterium]